MRIRFLLTSLIAMVLVTTIGCTYSREAGPAERTAANVGRVIDDSVLTARVKSALIADPTTKALRINVETYRGRVLLSGFVESRAARRRAVKIARAVEGVREVENAMELR
jgi:hyperosmotically inducible protein